MEFQKVYKMGKKNTHNTMIKRKEQIIYPFCLHSLG